jgi:hypothetical protein
MLRFLNFYNVTITKVITKWSVDILTKSETDLVKINFQLLSST